MGRQAYLTRLALGRSAYEPPDTPHPESGNALHNQNIQEQHVESSGPPSAEDEASSQTGPNAQVDSHQDVQLYDRRGHPSNAPSRGLARDTIRAQNDILHATGYLVDIDNECYTLNENPRPTRDPTNILKRLESLREENRVGLLMTVGNTWLLCLSCWIPVSIRNNLQVFKFWSKIPLSSMLNVRIARSGWLNVLFAGMPAHLICSLVSETIEILIQAYHDQLFLRNVVRQKSRRTARRNAIVLIASQYFCSFVSYATLAYPLRLFSILQSLGLLSCRDGRFPCFPNIHSFIPFAKSSPLVLVSIPATWPKSSAWSFVVFLLMTPLPVLWLHSLLVDAVEKDLHKFISRMLPKPDHPDTLSMEAAKESLLDEDYIPGIRPTEPARNSPYRTAVSRVESFAASALDWIIHRSRASCFSRRSENPAPTFRTTDESVMHAPSHEHGNALPVPEVSYDRPGEASAPRASIHSIDLGDLEIGSGPLSPTSPNTERILSSEMDPSIPPPDQLGQRQIPVERNPRLDSDLGNPTHSLESVATRNTRPSEGDTRSAKPKHRLTVLSSHSASVLSATTASMLASWLLMPLETVALRLAAQAFLNSASTSTQFSNAQVLDGLIYSSNPRLNTWKRGMAGCWGGLPWAKIPILIGLDIVSRLLVIEPGYIFTVAIGYRRFGWGNES